jgi:hypothetical protein
LVLAERVGGALRLSGRQLVQLIVKRVDPFTFSKAALTLVCPRPALDATPLALITASVGIDDVHW